mgnify:FL=1
MISAERRDELETIIVQMEAVTSIFYRGAIDTNNHAFIEFTGLISEYIAICRNSLEQGIDFTKANIHSDEKLIFHEYNRQYLKEKINCIYGKNL